MDRLEEDEDNFLTEDLRCRAEEKLAEQIVERADKDVLRSFICDGYPGLEHMTDEDLMNEYEGWMGDDDELFASMSRAKTDKEFEETVINPTESNNERL